jgi:putative transposase
MSERRACELAGLSRSVWSYRSRRREPSGLRERLRKLAVARPRFGYKRLHVLLRREGFAVNHKRIYRLYREENLLIRRKRRKRVAAAPRESLPMPKRPNERWLMDFTTDSLMDGRALRTLNVVDDYSRVCVAIEVDTSIGGARVGRVLDRAGAHYGWPERIVCDNGPEFTSRALDQWAYERGIQLHFIRPGRPVENVFVESFNGKYREECLSENWFVSLEHARRVIEEWRADYNGVRRHESLDGKTPLEYLAERDVLPRRRLVGVQ